MTHKLKHRGPDGFGYHINKSSGLAIGHSRLSIVDLRFGKQPLVSKEHKTVVSINGEFYDYKKIRTKLQLEGFKFSTKSDSEIVLPLYAKYGLSFVEHLRGEFAISMFDEKRNRLILIRDRFGVKPLYYHITPNCIYWASEMKSLFTHPRIQAKFDNQGIIHQLMYQMVPGKTLFKDVYSLKPGYMLIIDDFKGELEVREYKYWDLDFPEKDYYESSKSDEYYIEKLQEELTRAVDLRLDADVPVGCYLSGGLDSSILTSLASTISQSSVKAFTLSFDHRNFDESKIASLMAQHVGADHTIIPIKANHLYGENYVKTLWHGERTFYNTLGAAKLQMSKVVKSANCPVVLTGEGADELFGGYLQFKLDLFRHINWENASKAERTLGKEELYDELTSKFTKSYLFNEIKSNQAMNSVCGFTPSWLHSWISHLSIVRPLLHDNILNDTKNYDPIEALADNIDQDQVNGRHPLDIAQYTWIKIMMEGNHLSWAGDRVDMANSIESRPVFLDHRVVEVAREIPPWLRVNRGKEKWILRKSFNKILPESISSRNKFPFRSPFAFIDAEKKNYLDSMISQYLNEYALKDAGIFDSKRIQIFLKE
ncbi:MAG: asparagine synthase (glutamine-hydrolyzing), partial [Crocinitomicaceae bacterium]